MELEMAHYAFLDQNNVVVEVITGVPEGETIEGLDPETWYSQFRGLTCKRTSYNTTGGINQNGTPYRKNYAGIGYTYDPVRDAFIPPQPEGSWQLDEDTCLWVRVPQLGTVNNDQIITADGVDFVTVYIEGAQANSTQQVTVNGEPVSVEVDASGRGEFELSADTAGLLLVAWGALTLEIGAV